MTISVRTHAYVAAALLALAAPLAMLTALRLGPVPPEAHIFAALGGLTLVGQAIAFAYLPSFTKRDLVLDGLASYAGPILMPVGLVGAAFGLNGLLLVGPTLGLGLFGVVLLASALLGKPWRGGLPFWRAPGGFRAGDIAAAFALASAALWLIAAGGVAMLRPALLAFVWPAALALLAVGGLAHYVPRNRGRAMFATPFVVGVLAFQVGVALRAADLEAATPLLLGLPLAGFAIAPPGATKPAGARMREAAPFLALAVPFAGLAVGIALVGFTPGLAFSAYYAFIATVALALAGLALLTLPVVFNQRPSRAWLWPAVGAALVGVPLLAIGFLTVLPRWPGAALMAGALLAWLAMMAPLRDPRRECTPDEPSG